MPLTGLEVLGSTRILAGPLATMLLGDMGAQVVKIERPAAATRARRVRRRAPLPGEAHGGGVGRVGSY